MDIVFNEYAQVPIVTRSYCTACFLTTLAVQLDIATPYQLYFNPKLTVYSCQLWRLVTGFTFRDTFGFNFFFNLLFIHRYCGMLESGSFHGRTGDFVYMILLCSSFLLVIATFLGLAFLGQAFNLMIIYLWCRRNPHIQLSFLGLVTFRAPYLPWVLLAISYLLSNGVAVTMLAGIGAGHVFYFFEDVFPRLRHGFKVLRTPTFIRDLFDAPSDDEPSEDSVLPPQENAPPPPPPPPPPPVEALDWDAPQ